MSEEISQSRPEKGKRRRRISLIILMFLLMLAISVAIFVYHDTVARLGDFGYLGAFLISLVSSATILLPMPSMLLIFALGDAFNPALVGLAAAAGGTIGEITGYTLGLGGHRLLKNNNTYVRVEKWVRRWGMITIFIFAVTPVLPIDAAGIAAGTLRFPIWKFLLATLLGKALKYTGMAFSGAWGWEALLRYLD